MNEIKHPKIPMIGYAGIVMAILIIVNFITLPWLAQRSIKQVDYGTFIDMT